MYRSRMKSRFKPAKCTSVGECTLLRGLNLFCRLWMARAGIKTTKQITWAQNGVLTYTYVHTYTWKGVIYELFLVYIWMFACLCTYIRGLQCFFGMEVYIGVHTKIQCTPMYT